MIKENNFDWADNLRVLATFAVIVIHVSANAVSSFGNIDTTWWWIANCLDGLHRFCVPVFVMLSGALLLPKEYALNDFIKKRLVRIIIPFLFWSAIYILFFWYFKLPQKNALNPIQTIEWVYSCLQKGAAYHFWYIYMIIGLYLFVPIIGRWVRSASEKEVLFFLSIWVFTLFLNYPSFSSYSINIDLRYFTGYLGYLVLGYYLSTKVFASNSSIQKIALCFILIGSALTIVGNYVVATQNGKYIFNGFYSFLSPNIFLASSGVFLFIKTLVMRNAVLIRIRDFISQYSYGIYLIHVLILGFLSKFGLHWLFVHPFIGIPATAFACLLVSSLIIYLMHKLPYGKYIAG